MGKQATLQDFLAKKIKREEDRNRTIDVYVTSMDKTITLKKPTEEQVLEYANGIADGTDKAVVLEANRQLIYNCCEELHSAELREALEVKDPYDVTRILFDMEDVKEIMDQFNELMTHKNINEEIKNS